jgi:hypothetical protein
MKRLDYEIKHGKHIAFRPKDKQRFTRAKTISEDYTEERLKERISENLKKNISPSKKRVGNIIDIRNNEKINSSKAYEHWAYKHNLKTMADSVISLRELGISSKQELESRIEKSADDRQNLMNQIQMIESEIEKLSTTMENVETIRKYREHYKYYKENPNDINFSKEYSAELKLYTVASKSIMNSFKAVPKSKDILTELDELVEKKNTLMKEYSKSNDLFFELTNYKKNYELYMEKEVER